MKSAKRRVILSVSIAAIFIVIIAVGIAAAVLNARQEFLENYILLIVTAILSGFLVPFVLGIITEQKNRAQKDFENLLSRQNKVIEAQVHFLERISQLLWEFHALIAKVSYYKQSKHSEMRNEKVRAQQAVDAYEEGFWNIVIVNIQAEISKSRRLLSQKAHQELEHFYKHTLNALDQELTNLIAQNTSQDKWAEFHDRTLKIFLVKEIDEMLFMLAQDMDLLDYTRNNSN